MSLFQSADGVSARAAFSDHVWLHDGLDILAVAVLIIAASQISISRTMLAAAGIAALLPTIGIANSLMATPYWSSLFLVPGIGCLAFAVAGFWLASRRTPAPLPAMGQ